ncbi:spindle pole body-associated protein sad1 [Sarocladium implicatum]|nr:spindle pole body-associated protein sad1 [Sarocladium implicatum]
MPPRAKSQPKRVRDTSPNPKPRPLGGVDRVHLPKLQDTPSSRRQYSYGAAVEPVAPRRFTGDYADKPYTLENAIQHALDRQNREIEEERGQVPRTAQPVEKPAKAQRPRARKTTQEADADDELASAAFPPPTKNAPPAPSENDDTRSFAVESDVYGDATIRSTPDRTRLAPSQHLEQRSVNRQDGRRRPVRGINDPAYKDAGIEESSEDELGGRRRRRRTRRSTAATEQDREEEELSDIFEATAPTMNGDAQATAEAARSAEREKLEAKTRQLRKQLADKRAAAQAQAAASSKRTSQRNSSAPAPASDFRSDHSELDAAIQGDIQAREDAIDDEMAAEAHRQRWQQRWDYMQSFSPSKYLRQQRERASASDDSHAGADDADGSWPKLLRPRTYQDAFSDSLAWLSKISSAAWSGLSRNAPSPYNLAAFFSALLLFLAAWPLVSNMDQGHDLFDDGYSLSTFDPTGAIRSFSDNIATYLPKLRRSPRIDWNNLLDLSDFDSTGKLELDAFLNKYGEQFELLKQTGLLHQKSIDKLSSIVPKVVHMQLDKNGKPIVGLEFWHALRELIQHDDSILTVDDDVQLAKKNWKLVSSKIVNDPTLDSKLSHSVSNAESRMEQKITSLWDAWVQENESRLQEALGESLQKMPPTASDKDLDHRITKILKEQSKNNVASDGLFVTRDEFVRRLNNEFASHRTEIRAELNDLRPQVQELVRDAVEAIGLKKGQHANALSEDARVEIKTLVNNAVSTALANANIEALARGKIHNHWDTTLKNQINFFSIGSGATINRGRSSTTYDPYHDGNRDRRLLENGLTGARRWEHLDVLRDWSEDGEKWCAARDVNSEGKAHGYMVAVQLGRPVVPQQIIVEHILPGATIDPDARPRDMEVYIQIEDPELRERVKDFSATHVGGHHSHETVAPLDDDMVRVGRFTYVGAELHDGVHVHQLSSELIQMGAATEMVVVRAVSNYGAADHTCFYRLRMYGEGGEEKIVEEVKVKEKTFWEKLTSS